MNDIDLSIDPLTESEFAFAALGRCVYERGRLLNAMKEILRGALLKCTDTSAGCDPFAKGSEDATVNLFFGACRTLGDLPPGDLRLLRALQTNVHDALEAVDEITNGDLTVELEHGGGGGYPQSVQVRFDCPSSEWGGRTRALRPWEVHQLADGVRATGAIVTEVGTICLRSGGPKQNLTTVLVLGEGGIRHRTEDDRDV